MYCTFQEIISDIRWATRVGDAEAQWERECDIDIRCIRGVVSLQPNSSSYHNRPIDTRCIYGVVSLQPNSYW